MKLSSLNHSNFQFLLLGRAAAAAFFMVALSACSIFQGGQRVANSSLPIRTVDTRGGVVSSPRAYETSDRLFVTGSLRKSPGQDIPAPAHVDVQLVTADGRVLAEKRDNIDPAHPRLSRARHGRYPFVVSFPLAEAHNSARIIIRYHLAGHQP